MIIRYESNIDIKKIIKHLRTKEKCIDLNIVIERSILHSLLPRDDPHKMQRGILYRPVKGKIHGNLLDHKQTLGYTGHWAVLSERRSNTVNVCERVCMCAHLYVRREGESGARACKRTLAPWERSLVFLHLLFLTVTCSDLTRRDLDVDRVRFISPSVQTSRASVHTPNGAIGM